MRALVLVPVLTRARAASEDAPRSAQRVSLHSPEDRLAESTGLAEAIDLDVAEARLVSVPQPRPATLFGSGKVEEIADLVKDEDVGLVIVDHTISPVQQRNLERAWNAKVLDRTGLILEIFGRRARTREGRLQVELAHLSYQKGRLVRAWTHLERQRGGRGFLGGPGEAQIELDRRMLDERIIAIRRELEGVVRTRELHRKGRRKVPYPVVAIVGYTNAGKSTLFNRLTQAGVMAMDQVFATLDPTMREVRLGSGRRIILSDTVGFISDLPTQLVAAFRATLEEVIGADLVLHVRDIAHSETDAQAVDVEHVLRDLGVETDAASGPILEVWNKVDLLSPVTREEAQAAARFRSHKPVLISAASGDGLDRLLARIDARLGAADEIVSVRVPASEGRLVAWLHENAEVIARETQDDGTLDVRVRIASEKKQRLLNALGRAGLTPNV
ncbi:GTP-binding protein HflX [Hyphomicrobium nitrativorans NL23]|uniref:GTPase HflX n=1 Tax=Hyphomicrobium nitrativorans NL23 TaxID=1029756 RepID=V5SEA4_9HYPH|nr:GTPase HflX [Hyphomicrobium nitrativorans]AHB48812.1 GTP-binding protein HflX [Hyphomicrobium nitrativorans NL23]